MIVRLSKSPEDTRDTAAWLIEKIDARGLMALSGPLGAGKTEFARGVAHALGIRKPVTSPTFTLHKTYPYTWEGQRRIFNHLDLYRVQSVKEVRAIGFKELIADPEHLILVEWPEKIRGLLPYFTINIRLSYDKNPKERKIKISSRRSIR
ncbi:MAG: tRNA (adenosine(37)-N6)-threonylcarbamoyltransferase complex ATPase subunit type 1 TsaE [Candidatus Doudnabacteria bacterium RIFCSPHIGHO2_01_FULL_50_11]|uniref:tRNA threonylcarbamoyladenosine biosynthesis protein TsaE n=1 Tax=Candidatus Doudnabacteria bacterium RIFCSPHIGHO2_01_FULL_50_11 TaxID=1817828 RepID=A0A1F5PHN8_9BACT|nr:MAG: tRNA (adenosine(37)-N6)-threonylcarbamoyltransferase complex ATPase subunit type 1 TsaE [Candidatus Doudnabacteria bacterium RIFCSPHIGHO2_01_FULL_50_11]HLC44922.1 tRNA (adenosine(37)-N6)-threonylcarbamoyltransferase complex ATPase subunit type 1 TsaE [Patescibacteria group bacterium]